MHHSAATARHLGFGVPFASLCTQQLHSGDTENLILMQCSLLTLRGRSSPQTPLSCSRARLSPSLPGLLNQLTIYGKLSYFIGSTGIHGVARQHVKHLDSLDTYNTLEALSQIPQQVWGSHDRCLGTNHNVSREIV